ncbi:hypothetical protein SBRY_100258 [Actinacidiphila bryophytorum]|uniref:Uncharacterized protein n=1 Tax=Actinacidiphila bryophytorum TaxID=1436133 RepID=A0A9W4E4C1_9ACTN|nr:hypothetical protein SBRY_100258 [Actinacidiphila bryophytorum]
MERQGRCARGRLVLGWWGARDAGRLRRHRPPEVPYVPLRADRRHRSPDVISQVIDTPVTPT